MVFALVVTTFFLLDFLFFFYAFGNRVFSMHNFGFSFEIFIQIGSITSITIFYVAGDELGEKQTKAVAFNSLCFVARLLTINYLLMEAKDFKMIVETGKRLAMPFLSVLFALYLTMMIFGSIGAYFFGGMFTFDIDTVTELTQASGNTLYFLLNFNDFLSGIVTLFSYTPANNWNSMADMYCALYGNNMPRYFFSLYFVIMIFILLNIVISFVLEIYEVANGEVTQTEARNYNAIYLKSRYPEKQELEVFV